MGLHWWWGGGGRVSHLVIPEPAIDYPSFLCLSARPVKSGGVTQTNRSVFQSVRSREYLSRDCSDSAVSSAGHLDVKRATGRRVILRTKNSLVWSKLATESARKTEFWFRFGRHTHWWPAAGVLWQESILSFVASRRGRSGLLRGRCWVVGGSAWPRTLMGIRSWCLLHAVLVEALAR